MTITSCTAAVRRTPYASGRALSLADLHAATGQDRTAIGSVLIKRQQFSLVRKVPPLGGGRWGCTCVWVSDVEPKAGRQMVGYAVSVCDVQQSRLQPSLQKRAGARLAMEEA